MGGRRAATAAVLSDPTAHLSDSREHKVGDLNASRGPQVSMRREEEGEEKERGACNCR